jgi:integrase
MSMTDYTKLEPKERARILKLIGISKGVIVLEKRPDYVGKRYVVRVYDKQTGKYQNGAFDDELGVIKFARGEWSSFEQQLSKAGFIGLDDVLPKWIAALKARRNSRKHIAEIECVMKLVREHGVNDLKKPDVAERVQAILLAYRRNGRPWSDRTLLRMVAHFRALGRYCAHASRRWLVYNPFEAIERPSVDDLMTPALTVDECRLLVTDVALARPDGLYWAFRLLTGCRRQEASWARWSAISWKGKRIHVAVEDDKDETEARNLGLVWTDNEGEEESSGKAVKRRKERLMILTDELSEMLTKFSKTDDSYIFRAGLRSCSDTHDLRLFRKHLEACGVKRPKFKAHHLRSTNACLLLGSGMDIISVVEHLGHTSIEMTRKYAKRALAYREECRPWNGTIKLREAQVQVQVGCKSPAVQALPEAEGPIDLEDDIPDDIFVLLPDLDGIGRTRGESSRSLQTSCPSDSKSASGNTMWVQVPPRLPLQDNGLECDEHIEF